MDKIDKYGFDMSVGDRIDIKDAEIVAIDDDYTVHLVTDDGYFLTLEVDIE